MDVARPLTQTKPWCALAASAALAVCAAAAPPEPAEPDPGLDPTVLHSRVKVTNEFIEQAFDGSKNTTKLLLSYAFGNAARRDWTVQLDLPLVAHRAGDLGGAPDADGFGDVEMRIGHVFDGEGVFRWALGVETQFNTAAQPQLGDGVFRLSPGVRFRRAAVPRVQVSDDHAIRPIAHPRVRRVASSRRSKVKPAITIKFPSKFYTYVESELKWDVQDGDSSVRSSSSSWAAASARAANGCSALATKCRSPKVPTITPSPPASPTSFPDLKTLPLMQSTLTAMPFIRLLFAICLPLLSSCSILGLRKQVQQLEAHGAITVRVSPLPKGPAPTYALAWIVENGVRTESAGFQTVRPDGLAAFTLLADRTYHVGAFTDENGNRAYDAGEPLAVLKDLQPRLLDQPDVKPKLWELNLKRDHGLPPGTVIAVPKEDKKLGGALNIAVGEVASLDDPRFAAQDGSEGLWRPLEFLTGNTVGIFFTEPYDPARIPVVFVYGIGGSPQDLRWLMEHFDRKRYQCWFYQYPSGMRLERVATTLAAGLNLLKHEHRFDRCYLVAHSMGGLVSHVALTRGRAEGAGELHPEIRHHLHAVGWTQGGGVGHPPSEEARALVARCGAWQQISHDALRHAAARGNDPRSDLRLDPGRSVLDEGTERRDRDRGERDRSACGKEGALRDPFSR